VESLKTISIAGFRSIRSLDRLNIGRINVLVGANGAGKSNFLAFFSMLNFMMSGSLQEYIGRYGRASSLLFNGPSTTQAISGELSFGDGGRSRNYSFELGIAANDTLIFNRETYAIQNGMNGLRSSDFAGVSESPLSRYAGGAAKSISANASRALKQFLAGSRVYHFHDTSGTSLIRQSQDLNRTQYLMPNGGNLAAFLYALRESTPEYYSRILSACKLVVPALRDFILEPDRASSGQKIMLNWRGPDPDYVFGPHQFSDGALRAIAILTLLLQPTKDLPPMIVLDEPELGLHPYAIALIAAQLRAVSSERQVIVATQSPPLVDLFEEKDIVVVEQSENTTSFSRLNEGELSEWMEDFSLGQLLEKNVIGGGL